MRSGPIPTAEAAPLSPKAELLTPQLKPLDGRAAGQEYGLLTPGIEDVPHARAARAVPNSRWTRIAPPAGAWHEGRRSICGTPLATWHLALGPLASPELEPEPAEMPSFRPLPAAASVHGARGRQTRLGDGDAAPAPPLFSPRLLLLAALFVGGIATGGGGAYLLGTIASGTDIGRAPAAGTGGAWDGGVAMSSVDKSSSIRSRRLPSPIASGGVGALHRTEDADLSAVDKLERQIAERRLDQPEGDNALTTYRRIAATGPHEVVANAGRRLSTALWLLAEDARAAEHWEEALHYLEILKTLPPAPLAPQAADWDGAQPSASSGRVEAKR